MTDSTAATWALRASRSRSSSPAALLGGCEPGEERWACRPLPLSVGIDQSVRLYEVDSLNTPTLDTSDLIGLPAPCSHWE
jgi:hypothetical protein